MLKFCLAGLTIVGIGASLLGAACSPVSALPTFHPQTHQTINRWWHRHHHHRHHWH